MLQFKYLVEVCTAVNSCVLLHTTACLLLRMLLPAPPLMSACEQPTS